MLIETIVRPGGFVAEAHVHPHQTERFEVLEGTLGLRVGRERVDRGDRATPPRWSRAHRTGSTTPATRTCDSCARWSPALDFESLIETMFTLASEGKTNRKGLPNPLRLAVIARAHFDTVRLPFPPAWLQRAALALGAPLGRLLGYRPTALPA